jgi:type VI secretion system protein ImpL
MKLAITPRSVLVVSGLVLLALFVLIGGPYIAFADFRPLESLTARLVTILLIVLLRVAFVLVRRMRAGRATDKLMAGVAKSAAAADAGRPSDEAVQLRERFEEAVAALKQNQSKGRGLYDLPWYAFIGAPGSGKTTALVNSGLKFPLEQRIGKGALRGVGGTRNCDWWFTDEAVFLDTAGRYTTQDSDASADAAAWSEFLTLLREYRKRRPLNGVILTISAHDLMTLGADGRAAHVSAARRRLDELNQQLRVQLPVYVFVTKCDLVAGFGEYFGDLTAEGRAQVWGVTFSRQETTGGQAAKALGQELDALMVRLNERLFGRLEEETDARRRTKVFGFPQQMAALGPLVSEFVGEVFGSTRFDKRILLRGVYFTSGTQEGTPIDRLLSAIGRRFGMASEAVAPAAAGRGKAYFIESLLKDVLIGESGVAGLNWRQELRLGALQLGAYIAMVTAVVLGVILLSVSFRANRVYLAEVSASVDKLDKTPAAAAGAPLAMMMPRLDAVREVSENANRYREGAPWSMRWGLFQGTSVGNSARDAYGSQLRNALLPFLVERLERRLTDLAGEPDKLYEYLKAYLMLGYPERLDRVHLAFVAGLESGGDGTTSTMPLHLKSLFDEDLTLPKVPVNESLVAQARSTIKGASMARLVYNRLKLTRADDPSHALRLDEAAGVGADRVMRRKSGRTLSDPVPGMFTAPGFKEITGAGAALGLVKEFSADAWVWGEGGPSLGDSMKIATDALDIYEAEYVATWDAILQDIEPVPFMQSADAMTALATLAAPTSPLRGLLKTIDDNTFLVKPPDAAAPPMPGAISAAQQSLGKLFAQGKAAAGVPTTTPGTRTTAHFNQIHQLMAGAPAPIDRILGQLQQIRQVMLSTGTAPGQTRPLDAVADQQLNTMLTALKQDAAMLPPAIAAWITQLGGRTQAVLASGATTDLMARYRQEVSSECTRLLEGRYPFSEGSVNDLPINDFGRLFGPGGVFDSFFRANLEKQVDTTRSPWASRPGAAGMPAQMLSQFEAAQRIRRLFFQSGGAPKLEFTVTVSDLEQASKFKLDLDGQVIDYQRGAPRGFKAAWPGEGSGRVGYRFDGGRAPVNSAVSGPWAFFHFMDASMAQAESEVRSVLRVAAAGSAVRLRIDAGSVDNPFTNRSWRQFRCGF